MATLGSPILEPRVPAEARVLSIRLQGPLSSPVHSAYCYVLTANPQLVGGRTNSNPGLWDAGTILRATVLHARLTPTASLPAS